MNNYIKIKSYAKINLALNIIGKTSSLHKIESIISLIDLHDEILIKKTKNKNHKVKFIGKFSKYISSNNTISKLLEILERPYENKESITEYQIPAPISNIKYQTFCGT